MELCRTESDPVSYTTNSKEMANKMAIYHEAIQQKDLDSPESQREATLNAALQDLPKIDEHDQVPLSSKLTYAEIELALK